MLFRTRRLLLCWERKTSIKELLRRRDVTNGMCVEWRVSEWKGLEGREDGWIKKRNKGRD